MDKQPVSDDQELAKVLAGVTNQADEAENTESSIRSGLPSMTPVVMHSADEPADQAAADATAAVQPTPTPEPATPSFGVSAPASTSDSSELDSIKSEALTELRPLMDKLTVSPEEKYDIYLLLLRSTDDKALIAPAHEAAKAIEDETRRAQALLDIIKEIDFLSGTTPATPGA